MEKHILSLYANNHSGVLTRLTGLFSRRGYNIESLTACSTEDERFSRITIEVLGDKFVIEQITRQLDKLEDVLQIFEIERSNAILRELLLIKVKVSPEQRPEIESTANIMKARIVDIAQDCATLEKTGDSGKIDSLIKVLEPYGIIELARSGVNALERGNKSIKDYQDYNKEISGQ